MPNYPAKPNYPIHSPHKCKELHDIYYQCLLANNKAETKCRGEYVLYITCTELCTDYPHHCDPYINKIKKLYK